MCRISQVFQKHLDLQTKTKKLKVPNMTVGPFLTGNQSLAHLALQKLTAEIIKFSWRIELN